MSVRPTQWDACVTSVTTPTGGGTQQMAVRLVIPLEKLERTMSWDWWCGIGENACVICVRIHTNKYFKINQVKLAVRSCLREQDWYLSVLVVI